jgi:hypothetical protein
LDEWIQQGYFNCDPSLSSVPDPIICACQFGKALVNLRRLYKVLLLNQTVIPVQVLVLTKLRQIVPVDLLSANILPKTTSLLKFWVDKYSMFVYVKFHKVKEASEMVKSKKVICKF